MFPRTIFLFSREDNVSKIQWDFHDTRKREKYCRVVTELLRGIAIDPVKLCCFRDACQNRGHHDDIDVSHQTLVECMVSADQTVFGTCRRRWRQILGWNEPVQEAHSEARKVLLEWRAGGGPRCGPLVERMRSTRARFKLCLRWFKSHEQQLRDHSLAAKVASGNSSIFFVECAP